MPEGQLGKSTNLPIALDERHVFDDFDGWQIDREELDRPFKAVAAGQG